MIRSIRARDALAAGAAGFLLAGLAIARLTLALNPHLHGHFRDTLLLLAIFAAGYGAAGLAAGALGAAGIAAASRVGPRLGRFAGRAAVTLLGLGPLAYVLLLPDTGLFGEVLTDVIFARVDAGTVLSLAAVAAALALAGWGLAAVLGGLERRRQWRPRAVLAAAAGAAALVLAGGALLVRPADPAARRAAAPAPELPPAPAEPPARVVLLCIDGADPDDVIAPMVARGELPHFAELIEKGTWGSLATIEPTLSPVVWTSLITGRPPEEHGIYQFTYFRLPGLRQPILEFPLHTGLNFRFFPWLETLPGTPRLRATYTSTMRRVEALWNIVGRRYPVGAYRWLVSWPAEKVNGFSVAGAPGWVQLDSHAGHGEKRRARDDGVSFPPGLLASLPRDDDTPVPEALLRPYVGAGFPIDRDDPRLRPIVAGLRDPTIVDLPILIERFGVRFVAAAFYPADPFHHFFGRDRDRGGPYSDAIAERYRLIDRRLGELLDALAGEPTQLVIVSDHGFDFVHNHHTWAPPGTFLAYGPAFAAGREVEGLSIYDVAPLVLHLLDLPLPDDLPGARTGAYRRALSEAFLESHPAGRIETYEGPRGEAGEEPEESPQAEEIRDALKSLGYIE